nr:aminoacyl-tRNA synthetase, class 1a, anticodon-binding [Tanacetum cinerariifolium]
MAALRYMDEHNKVGYLLKPTGSDDYHQVIDFLRASHIRSPELGPPAIQATIDKTPYTITEDLVRSQLQLADDGGIDDLPIAEIYSGMDNLGYVTEGKLTFFKNKFSPQWRFLVHTILHCLSTKSGSWDQFGSSIVVALICLSNGSRFNWSSYIFKGMHGQSSDPNTASFSRSHETDASPFTNVDDEPLDGSFYMSPPRSTQAPPAGQPSGGCGGKVGQEGQIIGGATQDQEKEDGTMTVDSNIPPGGASNTLAASISVPTAVPTGASTVPAGSLSVPADVPPSVPPACVSNKGKSPMVEEDIPVKARTFKQMQEDILGEQAAKRLHDKEQAQLDRQRAELQRRRQQEVLDTAMYYTEEDWIHIRAQVEANASLSKTLLGSVLEEPSSKRQKSTEAPIPTVPDVPQSPVVSSPPSSGTRRKSLGRKRLPKPKSTLQELDLDADAQIFIKIVSNKDSDDEAHPVWSALIGWEVIPTPLGDINAFYRMDRSTSYFTTLREILHVVDRQDLLKLYGLVVKYYENHPIAGAGLILWGDLQVLFDSHEGGKGPCVWKHQHLWEISSWRLYTLSNVHILETVSGEVLYMFTDVSYPLSVKFMERILTHKLELDTDVVGNDMTTAEQLIQFIKNQLAAAQVSSV